MDSLTHIVLGACIGELFAGKQLGKKALAAGAIAQSIPDIDFLASFWLDPVSDLIAHRGFTHSWLFVFLITPLLEVGAGRWFKKYHLSLQRWIWFIGTELAVHLFLDAFNAYGTGWFEPFLHTRISFHTLFVADPLFSLPPGIAFILLLIRGTGWPKRKYWALSAVSFVCAYLLFSLFSKFTVENRVREIALRQNIHYKKHFTTPTPLNNLLWYAVLESDSGYYTSYRSLFDTKQDMAFQYFPRNSGLAGKLHDPVQFKKLQAFSQGYYTLEKRKDTLVFSDLRFGQIIGWRDPRAPFSFYYFADQPDANRMMIQRGRFANWNRSAFGSMLRRIRGE